LILLLQPLIFQKQNSHLKQLAFVSQQAFHSPSKVQLAAFGKDQHICAPERTRLNNKTGAHLLVQLTGAEESRPQRMASIPVDAAK
jgi:hypothetical protein